MLSQRRYSREDDEESSEEELEIEYVKKAGHQISGDEESASTGSVLKSKVSRETNAQVRLFYCFLLLELMLF